MLDARLREQLKTYLQNLRAPVEMRACLDDSEKAGEIRQLLSEISELHPDVSWRHEDDDQCTLRPSFTVCQADSEHRSIRFAGVPLGHEFTSLVLALLQVGGHPPKADPALMERGRELEGEFVFETFVSLSCQNCPEVVQALNLLAILNPGVRHTMIDGAVYPEMVDERQVMSVPSVYLNGELFGQGRMSLADILKKLDHSGGRREAEALSRRDPYEVLVIGGGPAGAAAAVYAARKGIRTGVVSERFGGQVLDTLGIENFISVPHTEGPRLAAALEAHVRAHEVDIMEGQAASRLEQAGADGLLQLQTVSGAKLRARSVILATGARWRELNVPGEKQYKGKGVAYCPHCDGPLFKGKRVAVIGGGNSGVEAAIDLAGIVQHVTLIEFGESLRADAVLQTKLKGLGNVDVVCSGQTTEVLGDGHKVTGLRYLDRLSGKSHEVELQGVFVQIGLLPNTEWLKGSLELTQHGEIEVDARGATSMRGVFAAGDVTTVPYKQIVIALGEGSKAALSAFDYLIRSSVSESESEATQTA